MIDSSVCAIILAAGKGTRMRSGQTNKVALPLGGQPLIRHTLGHLRSAGIEHIIAVVGYASASVKNALGTEVKYAYQAKRLGTAHAVIQALPKIPPAAAHVITLYGDDSAFYPPQLFQAILASHQKQPSPITLLTLTVTNPAGLGRIIRNSQGDLIGIVEDKNASSKQRQIHEINTGLFCFNRRFLELYVHQIAKNPISQEYYLTDIIALAVKSGIKINSFSWPDASVWHGVNTPDQLAGARRKIMR